MIKILHYFVGSLTWHEDHNAEKQTRLVLPASNLNHTNIISNTDTHTEIYRHKLIHVLSL